MACTPYFEATVPLSSSARQRDLLLFEEFGNHRRAVAAVYRDDAQPLAFQF